MLKVTGAAFAALVLVGCSDLIETTNFPDKTHPTAQVIAYYALPRAYYPLKISLKKCELSVSVDPATFLPEPSRYVIQYSRHDFTHDKLTIETDASGLLRSINSESAGETAALIGAPLELAAKVLSPALAVASKAVAGRQGEVPTGGCPKDFDLTYQFDPAVDQETEQARIQSNLPVEGSEPEITIKIRKSVTLGEDLQSKTLDEDVQSKLARPHPLEQYEAPTGATKGVWYRPAIASRFKFNFTISKGEPNTIERDFVLAYPDPDRAFFIPFKKRGLAKLDVSLTFDHGMLTKYESDDQSQVLAVLQLPGDLVKSILGLSTSSSGSVAAAPKKN
ncbi:MAG: hypothetical protein WAW96_11970 [Alphaproteobacteria bacterium]